jgi:glutathione S-transferase
MQLQQTCPPEDGKPFGAPAMKLYYAPGACSLACHIALYETGAKFEIDKVDLATKTTEKGEDFSKVNPYGYVPSLRLDSGEVLNEGVAILQYVADQNAAAKMAPANGTMERYRLQSALTLINSEIHKTIASLFNKAMPEDVRQATIGRIDSRLKTLSEQMGSNDFVANNQYSVADAYLFTVLGWLKFFKIDLNQWPTLAAHSARVASRPAVQSALKAEGLI